MDWVKSAWRGDERLWKVFWIYGFLASIIFGIVDAIGKYLEVGLLLIIPYGIFRLAYAIWLMVAEWRCAFNVEWRFWGYLMRTLIVLGFLAIVLAIIGGGGLIGKDMIAAARCRHDLREYIAKGGKDEEAFKQNCIRNHQQKEVNVPAASVPAAPGIDPNAPMDAATATQFCQQSMADFARDRGVDPQQYIAQNQAYLQECVQYHEKKGSTTTP